MNGEQFDPDYLKDLWEAKNRGMTLEQYRNLVKQQRIQSEQFDPDLFSAKLMGMSPEGYKEEIIKRGIPSTRMPKDEGILFPQYELNQYESGYIPTALDKLRRTHAETQQIIGGLNRPSYPKPETNIPNTPINQLNPTEAAISKMPSFLDKYNEASKKERMSRLMAGLSRDIGTGASLALQSGAHIRSGAQPFQFGPSGVMSAGVENAESAKRDVLMQEEYDPSSETSRNLREIAKTALPEFKTAIESMNAAQLKEAFPFIEKMESTKALKEYRLGQFDTRDRNTFEYNIRTERSKLLSDPYLRKLKESRDSAIASISKLNFAENPQAVRSAMVGIARAGHEVGVLTQKDIDAYEGIIGIPGFFDPKLIKFFTGQYSEKQIANLKQIANEMIKKNQEFIEKETKNRIGSFIRVNKDIMERQGKTPEDIEYMFGDIMSSKSSQNISPESTGTVNIIVDGVLYPDVTQEQLQNLRDDGVQFSIEQ